eukprot:TRINITY_DN23860_c0_g1_i1.p1 TRINITY_DN23860_c0_g1~~TRINITY_DN23860_c0_g1_i1.p1  ORF type:complete len:701 (+),score=98.35 TRINITY_DN23860_c0_g1_i1:79-2181(+)
MRWTRLMMRARGRTAVPSRREELLEALRAGGNAGGSRSDGILTVLAQMRAEGLLVDSRDYTAAANTLGKARFWQDAIGLLVLMDTHKVVPHIITINAMIAATAISRAWVQSLALLHEVRLRNLKPDVFTCNSVISACERSNMRGYCPLLLTQMRNLNVRPDVVTFSALISGCEKGQQWEVACQLFREARRDALRLDIIVYNAMISACEKGFQWELALGYLSEAERSLDFRPTTTTVTATIAACGKVSQWMIALTLLGSLQSRRLLPNVISVTAAIKACAGLRGNVISQLLETVRKLDLEPDVIQYSSLMQACADQWESAVALFAQMRHRGVTPDMVAYNILLSSLHKGSAWEASLVALAAAQASGLTPTDYSRKHVFDALADGRQWAHAAQLLREYRDELVDSSADFGRDAALVRACFFGSQWRRAAELLASIRERALQEPTSSAKLAIELHWEAALLILADALESSTRIVAAPPAVLAANDTTTVTHEGPQLHVKPLAPPSVPSLHSFANGSDTKSGAIRSGSRCESECSDEWRRHLFYSVALVLFDAGRVAEALSIFWEAVDRGLVNLWLSQEPGVVDLHNHTAASARLALLAVLAHRLSGAKRDAYLHRGDHVSTREGDLIVVVGRGSHSPAEESVLRLQMLALLRDELGLHAYESRTNPGRIRVPYSSFQSFCARPALTIKLCPQGPSTHHCNESE